MSIITQTLPDEVGVNSLLSSLFGKDVAVRASANHVSAEDTSVLATYCDDEGHVQKTIACSCEFANRVGASLTMFPSAGANEAIKANEVAEKHLENLSEILNICVNLFSNCSKTHIVLGNVLAAPDAVQEMLSQTQTKTTVSFEVDVPGYGAGGVTLSSVD